jgi:hypothetical protein
MVFMRLTLPSDARNVKVAHAESPEPAKIDGLEGFDVENHGREALARCLG